MKVLFAVSNEEISESIAKKYQKEYKEIMSYKNVYYFNAILKEIQRDKTYDRIVISEDLESFTHTQYDQIDKFIFDKLDSISDEASNARGDDIPIILICSDRRTKTEQMLVKLFGIGVYNAIIGNDRSIDEVCKLINKPRLKKDAKIYYKIEAEDVNYQSENENDVGEVEIQNILAYYKRLGKNEEKYIDAFDNIAAQYNDVQLRIISKFLPLNVRAVLEENSEKYQQIMSFNNSISANLRKSKKEQKEGPSEKLLKTREQEKILAKPIVIPSSMDAKNARKLTRNSIPKEQVQQPENVQNLFDDVELQKVPQIKQSIEQQNVMPNVSNFEDIDNEVEAVEPKKRRGRPRKNPVVDVKEEPQQKRRGRPRKNPVQEEFQETILPGFDDEEEEEDFVQPINGANHSTNYNDSTILPGFDDDEEDDDEYDSPVLPTGEDDDFEIVNPNYKLNNNISNSTNSNTTSQNTQGFNNYNSYNAQNYNQQNLNSVTNNYMNSFVNSNISNVDLSSLLTPDKKIVSFIGTSKNGTSFIVNNIAELLSSMGIDTAILDTTQNRNSYYIYTKNEEELRKIAIDSIDGLSRGQAVGIKANKNLTVYTSLPDGNDNIQNCEKILETLLKNHKLVLIDSDFKTPIEYFSQAQEIYLVQTLDVLTIQPLTAFLRELKAKDIINEKKLKIILNKYVKVRGISEKTIIGGMAFYNDPAMSFMTELFDRNMVKYITIPFEEEIYTKYLENIINCDISLKGYSKNFMQVLRELGNMVYPNASEKTTYRPPTSGYNSNFSSSMNNTLNQMKQRY